MIYLFFINLFTFLYTFIDEKPCDCKVKVIEHELRHVLNQHHGEVSGNYNLLLSKNGEVYKEFIFIRDSSNYWFFKTIDSNKSSAIFKVKKVRHAVRIQINIKDSIPIYFEPNKKSKVREYVKKPKILIKNDIYEFYLLGCSNGFVRVESINGSLKPGWISEKYYR